MQSCAQKCNAFQSLMGIFLHSCNAPEKIIKVLARMGTSISLTSIHRSIKLMSISCMDEIQRVGSSLLASWAYDNFDVKFNTGVPTVEGPSETLIHLTSGTLLELDHGVMLEDLRCSQLLWDRNPDNLLASDPRHFDPYKTYQFLYTLHAEDDTQELTRRGRFRAWFFQEDAI